MQLSGVDGREAEVEEVDWELTRKKEEITWRWLLDYELTSMKEAADLSEGKVEEVDNELTKKERTNLKGEETRLKRSRWKKNALKEKFTVLMDGQVYNELT